ncbi:hypothetical protein CRYUN_Cryun08bG0114300 [Craigia yunnanensis]
MGTKEGLSTGKRTSGPKESASKLLSIPMVGLCNRGRKGDYKVPTVLNRMKRCSLNQIPPPIYVGLAGAMTKDVGIPTGDKLILRMAGKSDLLSDTVSYTDIYCIVKEVVEGQSQNLLESVAQLIASTTLTKYPQKISAVRVKVGKPHVAVHGPLNYLGVEIIRYRSIDAPN